MVSPVLSNIYLHKLDEFVERELIPQHTRGNSRKGEPEYRGIAKRRQAAEGTGTGQKARELAQQCGPSPWRPDGPRLPPPK